MKRHLLLGLGLITALTGCAVSASVPGASFALVAPGPVAAGRYYPRPYYHRSYDHAWPAYAPGYARPRRYWR